MRGLGKPPKEKENTKYKNPKWKVGIVFEKHETENLVNPYARLAFNYSPSFKHMKPLVEEFFQTLQGLNETKMERVMTYRLHSVSTTKKSRNHPKVVFTKLKFFISLLLHNEKWSCH